MKVCFLSFCAIHVTILQDLQVSCRRHFAPGCLETTAYPSFMTHQKSKVDKKNFRTFNKSFSYFSKKLFLKNRKRNPSVYFGYFRWFFNFTYSNSVKLSVWITGLLTHIAFYPQLTKNSAFNPQPSKDSAFNPSIWIQNNMG